MVRRYKEEEKHLAVQPAYWLALFLIIGIWIFAFKLYFQRYENSHPDICWASSGASREISKIDGVLLWEENVIKTPVAGKVFYPKGTQPVRVSTGELIAKVVADDGRVKEFRAYKQGYFIGGTDGNENKWRYQFIWPELTEIPQPENTKLTENGARIAVNGAIGKIIPQPQNMRFIGLADAENQSLKKQIMEDKKLKLMMDEEDTISTVKVDLSVQEGDKIKLMLNMPWFKPSNVISRKAQLIIETGKNEGATIPRSAVVNKKGKTGVYLVRGNRIVYHEIKGRAISDGLFLVTDGIFVGEALLEDAKNAHEGRIQTW